MSESVTNAEVEDVLSSIRRLVGESKKPKHEEASSEAPERLVLTPQLRVSDHDVLHLGPEAAVSSPEDWYEFEEPPLPDGSDMGLGTESDGEGPEEEGHDIDDAVAHEAFSDAAEAVQPALHEQAPSDEIEPEQPDVAAGSAGSGTQRSDYSGLTAKIAALETAIARTKDQWEPDGEGRDAYAGTRAPAMIWRDNVELDGLGKPVASERPAADVRADPMQEDAATSDVVPGEEEVIDENMLRDLVSEIVRTELAGDVVANAVRAELQGDLGARITRNIRKLVRREIQLALAAQGLE